MACERVDARADLFSCNGWKQNFLNSEIYEISKFLSCDLAHVFRNWNPFKPHPEVLWSLLVSSRLVCVWYNGLFLATWEVFADLFGSLISTFLLGEGTLSTAQRVVVMFGTQNLHLRGTTNCNVFSEELPAWYHLELHASKTKSAKMRAAPCGKKLLQLHNILVVNPPHWIDVLLIWKHFCGTLHTRSSVRGKKRNSAANATRFDAFKTDWWTCLQTFWLEIMRSTLAYSSKADYTYWWGDERRKALGKGTSRNWGQEFWMFWVSWNCGVRELEKDHVFVCFRCLIVCLSCFHLISTLS